MIESDLHIRREVNQRLSVDAKSLCPSTAVVDDQDSVTVIAHLVRGFDQTKFAKAIGIDVTK
ncbi:MAG: hypothetical protein CMJ94_08610 [Planctomycetes bacterium]|nr:hypothetical protein [Planctomycetota bacterium]